MQFTETFGCIRAVQAFRREPRNDALHAELNEANRKIVEDNNLNQCILAIRKALANPNVTTREVGGDEGIRLASRGARHA